MGKGEKNFYRLTSQGRALWSRRAAEALPIHHRRIMGLVEFSGHREVIRSHLAQFPADLVDEWLTEFEAMNLIEGLSVDSPSLAELARKTAPPPLEDEDRQRISDDATFADISLSRLGLYVAQDRAWNRPPSRKEPKDTLALVVEDDPDQRAFAALRLSEAGYPVKTADNVKGLYEALKECTPDAIFLDIMLPDGDGFEVLATLRRHPTYAPIPIIMVTAKTAPEDVAKGLALGADAYVTKPFSTKDLVTRVKSMLGVA